MVDAILLFTSNATCTCITEKSQFLRLGRKVGYRSVSQVRSGCHMHQGQTDEIFVTSFIYCFTQKNPNPWTVSAIWQRQLGGARREKVKQQPNMRCTK